MPLVSSCGSTSADSLQIAAPQIKSEYLLGQEATVPFRVSVSTGDRLDIHVGVQASTNEGAWKDLAPARRINAPNEGEFQVELKDAGSVSVRVVSWLKEPQKGAKPDATSAEAKTTIFDIQGAYDALVQARGQAMRAWDEYDLQSRACFPLEGNRGNSTTWQSCFPSWVRAVQGEVHATEEYARALDLIKVPADLSTVIRRYVAALNSRASDLDWINKTYCIDRYDSDSLEACVGVSNSSASKSWDSYYERVDEVIRIRTEVVDGFVKLGMPDFTKND